MNILSLFFSDSYELYKIEFKHPLSNNLIVSTRGKFNTSYSNASFQWTNAVKGFCLLTINEVLNIPSISGGSKSLAASLDYAISKQPEWLKELIGKNLTQAFRRINSDRKNQQDVIIKFGSLFNEVKFKIFINNQLATSQELILIKNSLENFISKKEELIEKITYDSLEKELNSMMRITNIFSKAGLNSLLKNMYNKSFKRVIGNKSLNYSEIDLELSNSQRLGLACDFDILKNRNYKLAASGTLVAGLGIFKFLNSNGYNFNINYNFPHAVEIVRQLIKGNFNGLPDLLILGSAPAAQLLSTNLSKEYEILMFLPKVSHGIISSKNVSKTKYAVISDDPSLPRFIFEQMQTSGFINETKAINLEPDETFLAFKKNENISSILFFPHYHLNLAFNNCIKSNFKSDILNQDVLLLINKNIPNNEKILLNCLIRDAWLDLITNQNQMDKMISLFKNDYKYLSLVKRISGIYNFN